MKLAGRYLRNFEQNVGSRDEMFDLPLESIELVHHLGMVFRFH